MNTIVADAKAVAYCGLYCGACKAYLSEKCPGCAKNDRAKWCKIRQCCIDNKLSSCADCKEFTDVSQCKKFDNFMAKIFAFIFRSDRKACIEKIKKIGIEKFAEEMASNKLQSIKR